MRTDTRSAAVERLEQLGGSWFEQVLQAGGHATGSIRDIRFSRVAINGAIADMVRVHLTYGGGDGPATLVAKVPPSAGVPQQMDAAMGLSVREARFYAEYANALPVNTPRCYYASDQAGAPLLLEDLGGQRAGDQQAGVTLDDAAQTVQALAALHAANWEHGEGLPDWLVVPNEGAYAAMIVQLVNSGLTVLRDRFVGRVGESVIRAVENLAPRWSDVLTACAGGPPTLVHNDARADNIFYAADGSPVFIDWQVVARMRGTQDVGNFLAGGVQADDLSTHWQSLLRRYHDSLLAYGISGYSWECCLADYRQSVLYPLGACIALLGHLDIGDDRGLGETSTERALRHCAELNSFSTV